MCGHATIALGRYAVDYRVVPPVSPITSLTLQCPCGPVKVKVQYENNKTGAVSFESVPSFVVSTDKTVVVPSLGSVTYDLSYGGTFYVFVNASTVGLDLYHFPISQCVQVAGDITDELRKTLTLTHPDSPDLAFLYGTILTSNENGGQQLLCIYGDRQVKRVKLSLIF